MRLSKRDTENARLEIRLRQEVKAAAEAYALDQGYTSLAAMLRVVITQAAEKAQANKLVAPAVSLGNPPALPHSAEELKAFKAKQAYEKARAHLPHPDLVIAKDAWDNPAELYDRDPDLYEMFLSSGIYRLKVQSELKLEAS